MKFLHTADWHIGRTVAGRSREAEHAAALQQVLSHAREQRVDCLLIAGDLFDTATPSPESEQLLYGFFSELHGLDVPAVVIAGNHDHPRRFDALAPILRTLRLHVLGEPVGPSDGGVLELESRDGKECAVIATLPWLYERQAVTFGELGEEVGAAYEKYAIEIGRGLRSLARAFRPDAVKILMAHLLVDGASVGRGGGERELHMSMGIYGVKPQVLSETEAQYVALGHIHKPQRVQPLSPAWYSGSLLQLDFGEQQQDKFVNLVEVHPGLPAEVTPLPITAGRRMVDIGGPSRGVRLAELPGSAEDLGDAWLRVYVDVDSPVADLPGRVRSDLPNAVRIERSEHPGTSSPTTAPPPDPTEWFREFYRGPLGRGRDPSPATLDLLHELLEEESRATAEA